MTARAGGGGGAGRTSGALAAVRRPASAGNGVHIAFRANSRADVEAFYRAALAAGGTSDGAPGPRPVYGGSYYAAFVCDLDGNKIEAMCHTERANET